MVEELGERLNDLRLDDAEHEEEKEKMPLKYYIHIDLNEVKGQPFPQSLRSKLRYRIQKYMIRRGYYDPRFATNFIDDMMDDGETLETATDKRLRELANLPSHSTYELWCVRPNFDPNDFAMYVNQGREGHQFRLNILRIINNDAERLSFPIPLNVNN